MIVILKQNADPAQLNQLENFIHGMGLEIHKSQGENSTILGLVGDTSKIDIDMIGALDIVENVKRIQEPYKNANRKFHPADTVVDVGGVKIGGGNFAVIAGPCSVESEAQICEVVSAVRFTAFVPAFLLTPRGLPSLSVTVIPARVSLKRIRYTLAAPAHATANQGMHYRKSGETNPPCPADRLRRTWRPACCQPAPHPPTRLSPSSTPSEYRRCSTPSTCCGCSS